jgi:hypothetical protein
MQVAQYLHADTQVWEARVCASLPPCAVSSDAGPPALRTRSRSQPPERPAHAFDAAQLLSEQHVDVVEAIAAAHPALRNQGRPLLCHKLAALPAAVHTAACQIMLQEHEGVSEVGVGHGSQLLQAVQALRSAPALTHLVVGLDVAGFPDHKEIWLPEAALQRQVQCIAHVAVLTQLRALTLHSPGVSALNTILAAATGLPALTHLAMLNILVAGSDANRNSRYDRRVHTSVRALVKRISACSALCSLAMTGDITLDSMFAVTHGASDGAWPCAAAHGDVQSGVQSAKRRGVASQQPVIAPAPHSSRSCRDHASHRPRDSARQRRTRQHHLEADQLAAPCVCALVTGRVTVGAPAEQRLRSAHSAHVPHR